VVRPTAAPTGHRHPVASATGALVCSVAATVASAQDSGVGARVRSSSPFIRELVTRAEHESPTFRGLVATIEESNGIVYIENGRCRHGVHACLLLSVISTGGFRFLRIVVNADGQERSINDFTGTLGHELRHAIEVLSEPRVSSGEGMFSLYLTLSGRSGGEAFETTDAIEAGHQVARELSHAPLHLSALTSEGAGFQTPHQP
jgi:hypothetical protein